MTIDSDRNYDMATATSSELATLRSQLAAAQAQLAEIRQHPEGAMFMAWRDRADDLTEQLDAAQAQLAAANKKLEQWPVKWAATMDSYSNLLSTVTDERDHLRDDYANLTITLAREREKIAALNESKGNLKLIGTQMSNANYNWSQDGLIPTYIQEQMRDLYMQWDRALRHITEAEIRNTAGPAPEGKYP